MEHQLPQSLLEMSLLLAGAVFIGLVAHKAHLPVTVVLAVGGFVIAWAGGRLEIIEVIQGEGFQEVLVSLFLPILIFEAAIGLSTREFMRNLVPILALATVAMALAAALVGVALHFGLGVSLIAALLFGVLISATDPVAVVAVFRQIGVPSRLLTLVEGESMLNDGVAIVLFDILAVAAVGGALSVPQAAADFIGVFFGGAAIGLVIGAAGAMVLPRLTRLSAAALSVAVAYGGFLLSEAVFGFSGVMATVAAGVVIGGMLPSRAPEEVRDMHRELWDALAYIANALLFLFIGLVIEPRLIAENLGAIGLAIAAVLVARPLAILPLISVLERWARIPKVGRRNSAVMVWGGLRGGVALALALALPEELAQRELFIAMAGGVVLATLILNATTISTLVHYLGLDQPSKSDQYLDAVGRLFAVKAARERLVKLDLDDPIVAAHLDLAAAEAQDELSRIHLSTEDEHEVLTLRGLNIELETYQRLTDAGLLPPIAARTLMFEIEDEIEELEMGSLRVDAPRRSALPWYARLHRRVLGILPEPAGEDLTEVAYIEVGARRIAAQRAAEELERFKALPNIDAGVVDKVKQTFAHWEEHATEVLDDLHAKETVDRFMLDRRQAAALSRVASVQALEQLVESGLLSPSIARRAAQRIIDEIRPVG